MTSNNASTTTSRILSIVAGAAIAGSGLYIALCHIAEGDMKIAAVAIACGAGYAAYRLSDLWQYSKPLALLAIFGVICGEVFGLAQTAERILSVREERARVIKTDNQPHAVAKDRVSDAKAEVEAAVKAERDAAKAPAKTGKTKAETKKHAKDAKEARERLAKATAEARTRLVDAETALAKMEAPKTETKLAAKIGVGADVVDLGIAGLMSIGLLAFTLAFLGLGHGRRVPVAEPVAVKAARKSGKTVTAAEVVNAMRLHGKPVTAKELAKLIGVSETTARRHATNIVGRGLARKTKDGRRTKIELTTARPKLAAVA